MKQIVGLALAFAVALSTSFARGRNRLPLEQFSKIKQISRLTDVTPQLVQQLSKGAHLEVAIECEAGFEKSAVEEAQ